jgi:hypothetical protein
MAPELFNPEQFGRQNAKASLASDVYVLAMVMMEVNRVIIQYVYPFTI